MPTADPAPPAPFHSGPDLEDLAFKWDCDPATDGIKAGDVIPVGGISSHGFPCQGLVVALLKDDYIHLLIDKQSVSGTVPNIRNHGGPA